MCITSTDNPLQDAHMDGEHADDLLKRALIDAEAAASVALRVAPLTLSRDADRGLPRPPRPRARSRPTSPTAAAAPATAVGKDELMRVPLRPRPGRAPRTARRPSTCSPSRPARCATRWSAPTPCSTSGASRSRTSAHDHIRVDRRIRLDLRLPAHRLLPTALVSPEKQIVVTAVCSARPLAEGRPPMGIAVRASRTSCASIRCPTTRSAASRTSSSSRPSTPTRWPSRLGRQEASVQRFLELSGDDFPQTG